MARLDKLADEAIWRLVRSASPEPRAVNLEGQRPATVMFFVRDVIDACAQRAAPIAQVRVGPVAGSELLRQFGSENGGYHGVKILCEEQLHSRVQFFRSPPAT